MIEAPHVQVLRSFWPSSAKIRIFEIRMKPEQADETTFIEYRTGTRTVRVRGDSQIMRTVRRICTVRYSPFQKWMASPLTISLQYNSTPTTPHGRPLPRGSLIYIAASARAPGAHPHRGHPHSRGSACKWLQLPIYTCMAVYIGSAQLL